MSWEVKYKIVLKAPLVPATTSWFQCHANFWFIPGASIKGAARHEFQSRHSQNPARATLESLLFGKVDENQAIAGRMQFTDAVCQSPTKIQKRVHFALNRNNCVVDQPFESAQIPEGTEFIGKVRVEGNVSGIDRSIAMSTVLDIPNFGRARSRGLGQCNIEILERSSSVVFISYSWEDAAHKTWVLSLATEIINHGFDVILDQLCPSFDAVISQEAVNTWMRDGIDNCDKIIAVLTPIYKTKADIGQGGVGYEFNQLRNERGYISDRLNRYCLVLRRGDHGISTPREIAALPLFDMRTTMNDELPELLAAITT